MRKLIDKIQENNHVQGSNAGWCFVDAVTAGRFFRIDRAQENLHYVLDICDGSTLFILDEENDEDDEALISGVVLNDDVDNALNDNDQKIPRNSSNLSIRLGKVFTTWGW